MTFVGYGVLVAEPALIAGYLAILAYLKVRSVGKTFTFSLFDVLVFTVLLSWPVKLFLVDYQYNLHVADCSRREPLLYVPVIMGVIFGTFVGRCLAIRYEWKTFSTLILLLSTSLGVTCMFLLFAAWIPIFGWLRHAIL